MNKRAFLEGFFTASTVAFGGHFMWKRVSQQEPLIATAAPVTTSPASSISTQAHNYNSQLSN